MKKDSAPTKLQRFFQDNTWYNQFSIVLIISGFFGLLSSFVLTLDKIHVSADASYQPDCNISPILSCVSVMQSVQSEILGFPNQIVGIAAFSVFISVGVLMHFTKGFNAHLWKLLTLGAWLAFATVHWFIFQSLFVVGALCLWCMLTWIIVAPIAWYSLFFSLKNKHISLPKRIASYKGVLLNNHQAIVLTWYLLVIGAILFKFWYYWKTLI